jgi:hypothetical protein
MARQNNESRGMEELRQAEEMAYFRAELCLYSPESYTPEEKRQICIDMVETSRAILEEMRRDFNARPAAERARILDGLCRSGKKTPEWWWDVLVGAGDPALVSLSPLHAISRDALEAFATEAPTTAEEPELSPVQLTEEHRAILEELGLPQPEEWPSMSPEELDDEYSAIEDEMVRIVPLDQEEPTEREEACAQILMALEQVG